MFFFDTIFISQQLILIGWKKYDKVLINCNKLRKGKGECYAYHYSLLYLGYYKSDYELSYKSFFWLLQNSKLKKNIIDWGVKLFVEKTIIFEKNYELALHRINELLTVPSLKKSHKNKLKKILAYLNKNKIDI